jgi:hypothetical protein
MLDLSELLGTTMRAIEQPPCSFDERGETSGALALGNELDST